MLLVLGWGVAPLAGGMLLGGVVGAASTGLASDGSSGAPSGELRTGSLPAPIEGSSAGCD